MAVNSKRVLCVGLCCLDIVMICHSYPKEDSDQRCISHVWQRGGNASNSATIFSEFGTPCEILGTMSTDIGGEFMKNDFKRHTICFENCRFYDEYESPVSTVWINDENGSRTIVHSNKNMPEVTFEDFKNLKLENYAWMHFEIRPRYDDIEAMITYVREWNEHQTAENKIKISIEIEKSRPELRKLLPLGDVVFISKDFAAVCGYADSMSAVESLCDELKTGSVLICAWGDQGASAKSSDGSTFTSAAYAPSKIVNTLGAGDTFVAATILSLMRGDSVGESLKIGCQVAGTKCGLHHVRGLAPLCPYLQWQSDRDRT